MKDQTREDPKIMAAAERRMANWAMEQEIAARSPAGPRIDRPHQRKLGPYIAISRELGAGGSEVAQAVGRRLGWEVLDKGLLDQVADLFNMPRPMLELVDETSSSWVFDVLGAWLDRKIVPHEKYVVHLTQVVIAAARRGNVIFVGRGAQFLLPREAGLAVRIVAPERMRLERLVRQTRMSEPAARRLMSQTDRGRKEFVEQYFHHDLEDPRLFDMVLSIEHLGIEGAAEVVLAAWRAREEKAAR